jgi:hypothetical protein
MQPTPISKCRRVLDTTDQCGRLDSITDLIGRNKKVRQFRRFGNFNADTFDKQAKEHLRKYKILEHGVNNFEASPGKRKIVVENVASFKDCHFVVDWANKEVHWLPNKKMKAVMTKNGFEEIFVTHHTDPEK